MGSRSLLHIALYTLALFTARALAQESVRGAATVPSPDDPDALVARLAGENLAHLFMKHVITCSPPIPRFTVGERRPPTRSVASVTPTRWRRW